MAGPQTHQTALKSATAMGDDAAEEVFAVDNCSSYAEQLLGEVEDALRQLDPHEALILRLRFGIGERIHDLNEVGMRFGVPRARVQRIESRALRKLRTGALEELLRAQVDDGVTGHEQA